jgi:hypothetical protein
MFYAILLNAHSYWRWIVVLAAIWALVQAYSGWFGKRAWSDTDSRSSKFFVIALDIQFLLGILLYIVSPLIRAFLNDMSGSMAITEIRFFAMEHALMMVIAIAIAHIGSTRVRNASTDEAKHRNTAIWYTISLIILLAAIPWQRPLLRGL